MFNVIQLLGVWCVLIFTPKLLAQDALPAPDPLGQIRAEHVMISTHDFDGTVAWYQSILGFEVTHQWTVPELPGLKLGYMARNGFVIEVVETLSRQAAQKRPATLGETLENRGLGHLAFLVADVDAAHEALLARGADVLVPPTSFPDSGRRLTFVFDNNGNLLEFLTPLSAYAQPVAGEE